MWQDLYRGTAGQGLPPSPVDAGGWRQVRREVAMTAARRGFGRVGAGLLAVLALTAACSTTRPGGPRATTAPPTAATSLDDCVGAGQARLVAMPHGPAAVLGHGPAGVVLSNQSDRNLCGWLPFGRVLAARGFQALLYDYGIAGDLS